MADPIRPLLNLDTIANRPFIAIDGVNYFMRADEDFSILQYLQHKREIARLAELMNMADDLSVEQETEFRTVLARFCARVVDAPADVLAKLSDGQRIAITNVFFQLLGPTAAAKPGVTTPAETTAATTATGEKSSPDSSDSTAAIH